MASLRPFASGCVGSPLSRAQLPLWVGQRLDPNAPLYNMAFAWTIEGELETARFEAAFEALVLGSDALRTVFEEPDAHAGLPCQYWRDDVPAPLAIADLAHLDAAAFEAWLCERSARVLDLSNCAYDSVLVRRGATSHVWFFNQHHLICDVTSCSLAFERLSALYASGGVQERHTRWPRYADEVARHAASPATTAVPASVGGPLRDAQVASLALFGKALGATGGSATVRASVALGAQRSARLRDLCSEPGVRSLSPALSHAQLFAAVLAATLYRLADRSMIEVGMPTACRPRRAQRDTMGAFVQVLPVTLQVSADDTFRTLASRGLAATLQAFRRSSTPADGDARASVVLNYLDTTFGCFAGRPTRAQWRDVGHADPHHGLRVHVESFDAQAVTLHFDFNRDAFDATARDDLQRHYLTLLDALLENLDQRVAQVLLLSGAEVQARLVEFNRTSVPNAPLLVHQRFEAMCAERPDAVAVEDDDGKLHRYRDVNRRANRLAHRLRAAGVRAASDDRVAILLERSPAAVVAMLGVLKAGAAYVPLDVAAPAARIGMLLEDVGAIAVLTSDDLADRVPPGMEPLRLDSRGELTAGVPGPPCDISNEVDEDQLAYVIYTSGSTGAPKGVMVRHGGLANYVDWASQHYRDGRPTDMPLFTSLAFDLAITSVYLPLVTGGRVVIFRGDVAVFDVFAARRFALVKLTPAHLALLTQRPPEPPDHPLDALIVGGEDFKRELALRTLEHFGPSIALHNEYGPTETVVGSMAHRFDPLSDSAASVPIGSPVANTQVYVLDANGQPTPGRVTGELAIGGAGVARGYLHRPELTDERFVPADFSPAASGRLYRTGDLARWSTNGEIEFLGRADDQVKVKGVRIELGEVEAALLGCDGVAAAVATVVRRGDVMAAAARSVPEHHCTRCGLPSNYPGVRFDAAGVCNTCLDFEQHAHKVAPYFRTPAALRERLGEFRRRAGGEHDCVLLLSGGKDSTYMLYRMVREFGANPLVFSLDNGFISPAAKANIERVTTDLGVELVWGRTPHMNAIFVESLRQHANVCNGCFKTIYTLSMNLARERAIPCIVTGLARGQLFETRLTDTFDARTFDPDEIDRTVLAARKAYHRIDDTVSRCLDVAALRDDAVFEAIEFVDFYRYIDVSLAEVYAYLDEHVPWIRPQDTGRSTNCLINDVGIYVHKRERGYHNYALPYAWDVRLGHKQRDSAMDELDDDIDEAFVRETLDSIGYSGPLTDEAQLAVYYVPSRDARGRPRVAAQLRERLPASMQPTYWTELDALPLTANGKVDRAALPVPGGATQRGAGTDDAYVAPRNSSERRLAEVWADVFRLERVGVTANFFDLGGDSMVSIALVARAAEAGLALAPRDIFTHYTIEALAQVVRPVTSAPREARAPVATGARSLTPIEHWWASQAGDDAHRWALAVSVALRAKLSADALQVALARLVERHAALRTRFEYGSDGLSATVLATAPEPIVIETDAQAGAADRLDALERHLDPGAPRLLGAVIDHHASRLHLCVHHLATDGVSMRLLLDDLEQLLVPDGDATALPAPSAGPLEWAQALERHARSTTCAGTLAHWQAVLSQPTERLVRTHAVAGALRYAATACLDEAATEALLARAPKAFGSRVHELLLAALAQALHATSGPVDADSSWCVDVEGHGRIDDTLGLNSTRSVGWFATVHPQCLPVPAGVSLRERLIAVKEAIRATPHDVASFGLLRYGIGKVAPSLRGGTPRDVLFNYLGQPDRMVRGDRLFAAPVSFSGSRSDQTVIRRAHALVVDALVRDGRLEVALDADAATLDVAQVQTLADGIVDALAQLVALCDATRPTLTPSDVPLAGLDQPALDALHERLGEIDAILPLSALQQGMLFHAQLAPESGFYALQFSATLAPGTDVDVLERAWQHVVSQHPSLRTVFMSRGLDEPRQCVLPRVDTAFRHLDWRDADPATQRERLARLIQARAANFDLERSPPSHMTLVRLSDDCYRVVWDVHHIAIDRRSMVPLFDDWRAAVTALRADETPELSRRPPFADYLHWAASQDRAAGLRYWRARLAGFKRSPTLRADQAPGRPPERSEVFTMCRFGLEPVATDALRATARRRRVTPNTVIQGIWAVLLARWSGERDVVFGAIVPGRPADLPGAVDAVGMYVNTLPARLDCDPTGKLDEWLAAHQVDQATMRQFDFQSLTEIALASEVPSGEPLFETAISVQSLAPGASFYEQVARFGMTDDDFVDWNSLPLTVAVELGDTLDVVVKFDTSRFDEEARNDMTSDFRRTLAHFADDAAPLDTVRDLTAPLEPMQARGEPATSSIDAQRQGRRQSLGRSLRRRARAASISTDDRTLVRATHDPALFRGLAPGGSAPLCVTPSAPGVELAGWCDAHRDVVSGWMREHGALLFRGFDVATVEAFEACVAATSTGERLGYRDRTTPRTTRGDRVYTSTVYPHDQRINLHNEGTYWTRWPLKLYFCCMTPATTGGRTPLADVRAVHDALPPYVLAEFTHREFMLVRNFNSGFGLRWQEVFQTDSRPEVEQFCRANDIHYEWGDADRLRTRQVRPAVREHPLSGRRSWFNHMAFFHHSTLAPGLRDALVGEFGVDALPYNTCYGDGAPVPDDVVAEVRAAYDAAEFSFAWASGDILLLDNMTYAHGREPFTGQREVLAAMTEPCDGKGDAT